MFRDGHCERRRTRKPLKRLEFQGELVGDILGEERVAVVRWSKR